MDFEETTKVDIETELKAMAEGQCPLCRIGGTHIRTKKCYDIRFKKFYLKMEFCQNCNYLYDERKFEKCPMCKP